MLRALVMSVEEKSDLIRQVWNREISKPEPSLKRRNAVFLTSKPGSPKYSGISLQVKSGCWKYDWVLEFDIKGLFDHIPHNLLMTAVLKDTECPWVILYIKRWLTAPVQDKDGQLCERDCGTPHDCMDAGGRAMQEQLPRVG